MAKILVIEDNPIHQDAARQQLKDHDLTIINSCSEIQKNHWKMSWDYDIVLTDVNLPSSYDNGFKTTESAATGFAIAFKALQMGVKKIGILTDANHHQDAISETMSMLRDNVFAIGDAQLFISANALVHDETKDAVLKNWGETAEKLLGTYKEPVRQYVSGA